MFQNNHQTILKVIQDQIKLENYKLNRRLMENEKIEKQKQKDQANKTNQDKLKILVNLAKTLSPKSGSKAMPISPSKSQNAYKAKMLQL